MVIWGGSDGQLLDSGGRYDPTADTWTATSTVGAPEPRRNYTAVSTGARMLVWGGDVYDSDTGATTYFGSGGEYDPATDSWTATSTVDAPEPRSGHSAVWTGSRVVVWGGRGETGDVNSGAQYDPLSDAWQATSTGWPVPPARAGHGAVWTGVEMIVWGGGNNTGGRYDPLTDGWVRTSTVNTPSSPGRSAVWVGSRMVVWGGRESGVGYLNTGGRYDPATDSWEPTSTQRAPSGRGSFTTVSTGDYMMIWGGWFAYNVQYNTGGRYALGHSSDDDGDSYSNCDGDCNDMNAWVYPWAPEVCDGVDNQCPGETGHGQIDVGCNDDGDGYCDAEMITIGSPATCIRGGGDCDDTNLYIYPGAPEVNDGIDNQCPGDPGYGVIDETSGNCGFNNPNDKSEYSWPAQPGAVQYEVVRSDRPDFYSGCTFLTTTETAIVAEDPEVGETHFYLNRPVAPFMGSWGQDSLLNERFPPCASGIAVINFQPEQSALPAWYRKDWGQAFDEELGYGWNVPITGNTRERDLLEEQRLDTFVFSQVVREWNLALPVGTYAIDFISGDAAYPQGPQQVVVEGNTAMDGVTMPAGEFWAISVCADVGYGKLTIEIGGQAGNTILNSMFVEPESCAPGTVIVRGIFTP